MNSRYIEASVGKRWELTDVGNTKEFVRDLFNLYPMYKHKVPAKWILSNYVHEVAEVD